MDLALLAYTLIACGIVVLLVSVATFFKLTNWLIWLKGNIPVFVAVVGGWMAVNGVSLISYLSISDAQAVMNASVIELKDKEFRLVIDDGMSEYQLTGRGDHFQTNVNLVLPNQVWQFLGWPSLAVLDSVVLETNRFERSVLEDEKERWQRDYGVTGPFHLMGMSSQQVLSRQLPLVNGALYSLMFEHDRLTWVAVNDEAKKATSF